MEQLMAYRPLNDQSNFIINLKDVCSVWLQRKIAYTNKIEVEIDEAYTCKNQLNHDSNEHYWLIPNGVRTIDGIRQKSQPTKNIRKIMQTFTSNEDEMSQTTLYVQLCLM